MLHWLAVALLALAAACTTTPTRQTANPHYKVGKPYQVNGRWYHPKEEPDYNKTGVASWYGTEFHGRLTANGEIFDMGRLTAAHTTLPLPSMVEVTNLENGKSITVRVNDRGPFARERIIDLSREAARQLGFEQQGTARVRVRYAGPAPLNQIAPSQPDPQRVVRAAPAPAEASSPPESDAISDLLTSIESAPALTPGAEEVALAEAESGAGAAEIPAADLSTPDPSDALMAPASGGEAVATLYIIRVAALSRLDNIDALRAALGDIGPLRVSRVETADGKVFYRINLGPFASIETAAEKLAAVRAAGYADAALVTLAP
ncbi:MAG: septal ring lytic transglycosylase RlpA family protein [Parvularculaceae bacterium]